MQLTKFNALLDIELRVSDPISATGAGYLAYFIWFDTFRMSTFYAVALVILLLVTFTASIALRVYEQPLGERPLSQYCCIAASWAAGFAGLIALAYLLKVGEFYSRGWVSLTFILGLVFMALTRLIVLTALRYLRRQGIGMGRCLLVGATDAGIHMVDQLESNLGLGMKITAYVKTSYDHGVPAGIPMAGSLQNIDEILDRGEWDQVLVALPVSANRAISYTLDRVEERVMTVKFVPDLLGRQLINHRTEDCAGVPIVTLRESPLLGHAWILKGFEDRLIAGAILLLIAPVMLMLALGVKLSSPGPVLYRQRRVGLDGKEFEMLKFRSMPVDMEKNKAVQWGSAQTKTTTRFGRFIRQSSLDELPQFINVLRGDMSIVGPRPERPMFVEKFKGEISGYMHKHLVKAGITGWAQINGWRGDTDLVKRIEHDLYYINHWSLGFDLRIILLTIFKGFVHSEAPTPAAQPANATAAVAAAANSANEKSI
ncbi:putative colanic acid biosynthesis UDP-glucose lipid carrier transferase [Luteibacter sp. OK325]|uniref:undecaprenyl-phosphate glucose phosphotransferase n=1 Tax=Luteibacter sp. OK325 TaxID=2135670 RepID=UPI000D42C279|nr:undecaprenyl-phosphate glucose phosphotransferase [Luteibacter sp. OK325]PTR30029.1 putative colanic acid biosynthesis UDP-glucose lipid carrier transferase [Luteibacter sp. OK325]